MHPGVLRTSIGFGWGGRYKKEENIFCLPAIAKNMNKSVYLDGPFRIAGIFRAVYSIFTVRAVISHG